MTAPVLPAVDEAIVRAAAVLRAGGLVAFPTETVYGLGAIATSTPAVTRVFDAKGRPADHPLIVHVPGPADLATVSPEASAVAHQLAERFWPGPLTVVVPRGELIVPETCGGLDTVAVRAPAHPVAQRLLAATGLAVAAPSANRFGRVSPTTAAHVAADLGEVVDLILDGGPCSVGVESTIVDCTTADVAILRTGGVTADELAAVLGRPIGGATPSSPRVSGSLASHYAPACQVVLVADQAEALAQARTLLDDPTHRVGLLAPYAPADLPAGVRALAPAGDAESYARVLYDRLREADTLGLTHLITVPPPPVGLGVAVTDRLRRAAAH